MDLPPVFDTQDEVEPAILFHQEDISFQLQDEAKYINWIQSVIQQESAHLIQLNYIFCSDPALLKVNLEYLDHDTYTDIITFPYASSPSIEGDIFISIDRVKENATKFEHTFEEELRRVMIHGVLHLCGYGDISPTEKQLMRQKEEESMQLFLSA